MAGLCIAVGRWLGLDSDSDMHSRLNSTAGVGLCIEVVVVHLRWDVPVELGVCCCGGGEEVTGGGL